MRFEKLLWVVLAMFLSGGAGDTLVGAVSDAGSETGSGEYQALDGTAGNPPPRP